MNRLHVFAAHATSRTGHDEVYLEHVKAIGKDVEIYLPKETEISKWNKVFPKGAFGRFWTYYSLFRGNRGVFFIEQFGVKELIFILVAALLGKQKDDVLALLFRRTFYGWKCKLALGVMKWVSKVKLYADSELIPKSMGFDATIVPIPHVVESQDYGDEWIMWWPGRPRVEKGLEDVRFLAKYVGNEKLVVSEEARMEGVVALPKYLDREEYEEWFGRAKVILLPYDPFVYRTATSGIFVEAVVSGKMPVVKDGSWLAYELKRFGLCELIIEWDTPAVVEQIKALYHDEGVRNKLRAMQEAYRQYHCFEGFREALKDLVVGVGIDELSAGSLDREEMLVEH